MGSNRAQRTSLCELTVCVCACACACVCVCIREVGVLWEESDSVWIEKETEGESIVVYLDAVV